MNLRDSPVVQHPHESPESVNPVYMGYFLSCQDSDRLRNLALSLAPELSVLPNTDLGHVTVVFSPGNSDLFDLLAKAPATIAVKVLSLYVDLKEQISAFHVEPVTVLAPDVWVNDGVPHITALRGNVPPVRSKTLLTSRASTTRILHVPPLTPDITLHAGIFVNRVVS